MKTIEIENLNRVFRTYDIRGLDEKEIDELLCFAVGYALGKMFKKIVVGHDHRKNSEKYALALIKGINANEIKPIFIDLVPTPLVQYAMYHLKQDVSISVTASHNPKEYNGIKVFKRIDEITVRDWELIKKIIIQEREKILSFFNNRIEPEFTYRDIKKDYMNFIRNSFTFSKKFKIVIDGSNGPAGKLAEDIMKSFGFSVISIACDLDPEFSSHAPDPSKEKNTEMCKELVIENSFDLGICFDGDGDRVIFIDERGRFIPGDYALAILSLGISKPRVVTEVKVSKGVQEFIQARGSVTLERVGNIFIRKKIKNNKGNLGGEYSGHYFFSNYPVDDGIFTALKVLEVLENENKPLGELFDKIPRYIVSPEYRIKVSEDVKQKIIESAKNKFSKFIDAKIIDIDGVRVEWKDAWFLIRPSNTEPKISLRFEGKNEKAFERTKNLLFDFLKSYGIKVVANENK